MTRTINSVCVVGAGFMGNQIALQCAAHGKHVWMHDVLEEALERSREVEWPAFLDRMIDDGYANAGRRQAILERVRRTTDLQEAVAEADIVIEAVREGLGGQTRGVLGTSTNSVRRTRCWPPIARRFVCLESSRLPRGPTVCLTLTSYSPVWKHPFVELMRGSSTSEETLQTVQAFMASINVIPVLVRKESTRIHLQSNLAGGEKRGAAGRRQRHRHSGGRGPHLDDPDGDANGAAWR